MIVSLQLYFNCNKFTKSQMYDHCKCNNTGDMTSNEFFPSEVAKFISENAHKFYDAKLVTSDNYRYPINKVVLAVRSDFFKCLFKNERITCRSRDAHGTEDLDEFALPSISHQALEPILHWVYHNEMKVNNLETVQMVLESAEFLGLEDMSEVCQEWIQDNMDAHNILGVLSYAQTHFLKFLESKAWDLLLGNLPEVAKGDEWLQLDAAQVAEIIGKDQLLCEEEEVWTAVIKWAEHHQKLDEDIIKEVRLGLLSERFFNVEVRNHPLVKNNPILLKALLTALSFINRIHSDPSNDDIIETPSFAVPRCPSNFMFIFGGWGPVSTISVYDPRADMWQNVEVDLPFPWVYMSSVTHNNKIYLAGGATLNPDAPVGESTEIVRNLWRFDPQDLSLKKLSHMREKRNYSCMVTLNDEIYALGGHNGSTEVSPRINTGEVYKISRNQWYPINPMNEIRSDFGAAVFDGKIFAVGGLDGFEPRNTVEVFNPATGSWRLLPPMLYPRSGVKCVSLRGKLVVVGGFDGTRRLSSCEIFDPKESSWSYLPSMTTPRSNHALSVVEGKIVAAGGFDGSSTTDIVEIFDWDLWKWRTVASLPTSLSAMTSAVVVTTKLGIDARERFRFRERENILEERKLRTKSKIKEDYNSVMGGNDSDTTWDDSENEDEDIESSSDIEEYDSTSNEEESIDMEEIESQEDNNSVMGEDDSDTTLHDREDENEDVHFIISSDFGGYDSTSDEEGTLDMEGIDANST